jgi:hypothetical protein
MRSTSPSYLRLRLRLRLDQTQDTQQIYYSEMMKMKVYWKRRISYEDAIVVDRTRQVIEEEKKTFCVFIGDIDSHDLE